MARAAAILLLLLALPAAPSLAEIYRWSDERGLHFTTSLDQVPPEHREAALAGAAAPRPDRLQIYASEASASEAETSRVRGARTATVRVPFQRYGHLMKIAARVNGAHEVPFLIDTGASGVSLPRAWAERLGIRVDARTPRILMQTANGVVKVPVVELASVELGGARVENLSATVNDGLEVGLLGGAFFNNFVYGVDAAAGVITLEPNREIVSGLRESEWRERFRELRSPLSRVERYLEEKQLTSATRRRELEQRRDELAQRLEALDREASHAGVPASWRE